MSDPTSVMDPRLQYGAMGLLALVIIAGIYFAVMVGKAIAKSLESHAQATKDLANAVKTADEKAAERHTTVLEKAAERHGNLREHISTTSQETRHNIRSAIQMIATRGSEP